MRPHNLISKDTYVSFDIETTGLVVGVHSIISLGAVAYRDGKEISHFYGAMHEREDAERDPGTMTFWQDHLEEWKQIRKEAKDPRDVMTDFTTWLYTLPRPITLAANPSAFDASMLWFYLHKFAEPDAVKKLIGQYRALDIRTLISALFAVPYSDATRSLLPTEWSDGYTITHNALEDAREQGAVLIHLLEELAPRTESVTG